MLSAKPLSVIMGPGVRRDDAQSLMRPSRIAATIAVVGLAAAIRPIVRRDLQALAGREHDERKQERVAGRCKELQGTLTACTLTA
ncbi:hypothetical protein [Bradyrhizobium sp. SZCCHNR1002]|uniref:hypothetical protein n=1 Tax=Bradyrhizobium sp. SZCCHNR1002 TaxID=3057334 RepID=UPI0028E4280C|nr:hypothetical protein [Bradyrhizobium sp. SZCCHNR1002]